MSRNGSPYHRLLTSGKWRALRQAKLSSDPFCADCAKEGVLTAATDVHHVVPVDEGANPERMAALAYDAANLVSLCHACHVRRHTALRSHSPETRKVRARKAAEDFWARLGDPPGGDF